MVTVADSVLLVANVRSGNVMADRVYRLIPRGARVRLSAVGSTSTCRARLFIGGTLFVDESLLNLRATQPEEDKDVVLQWSVVPGGEVLLTFISVGADTVRWKLDLA